MAVISFVDETTSGQRSDGWGLQVLEESLPLRELIRRRIFQEVAEHHARRPERFTGLVQPTTAERALNGEHVRAPRRVDPQEQFDRAVEAFSRNVFFVIVDDRQVSDLDVEVDLRSGPEVIFLKLVPLVGG
ncbi:hypothetical protein [Kineococcus sp. SYSU DK005]|uniref:hypothetical protein n=1 Tax=Kineococcus sp. SYSU DK005 TaxID=3383126 RepID=UPI003D7E2DB8